MAYSASPSRSKTTTDGVFTSGLQSDESHEPVFEEPLTIPTVLEIGVQTLRRVPAFKRIQQANLHRFILDVYFVGVGVRTGFLFDTFSVSSKRGDTRGSTASTLAEAIRTLRESLPAFHRVILVHILATDDFYFVNYELLLERFPHLNRNDETADSDLSWTTVVSLTKTHPSRSLSFPVGVHALLNSLQVRLIDRRAAATSNSPLITLDTDSDVAFATSDLIPFAALLLEYPVAYAPTTDLLDSNSSGFLAGIKLEVFTCALEWSTGPQEKMNAHDVLATSHTLLQFSYPPELGDLDIANRLRERFGGRVTKERLQCKVIVTSRIEQLERVAL